MNVVTKTDLQEVKEIRVLEEKWGLPLMQAGWTVIPSVILQRQQALRLDPVDVNIILHLLRHWWKPTKLPYPSKATIAQCIGRSESVVQKRIAAMEKRGLIKRRSRYYRLHHGQTTNEYDLDGLIKAATELAKEELAARAQRKKEDAKRRISRRLTVVTTKPAN